MGVGPVHFPVCFSPRPSPPSLHANEELLSDESEDEELMETANPPTTVGKTKCAAYFFVLMSCVLSNT